MKVSYSELELFNLKIDPKPQIYLHEFEDEYDDARVYDFKKWLSMESTNKIIDIFQIVVQKIEEIVKWELSEQNRLRETADFQEGIKASLERRDPEFTGN